MTTLLLCCLLSLLPTARAQAPTSALPAPPVIEEVIPTAWITREVPLARWPDADAAVRTLAAGDEVEVVLREGERVRVRRELDFGWVPADAVADQPPAAADPAPAAAGG